jgi:cytochrome b561
MRRAQYLPAEKILHWAVVVLIAAQFAFGWLMPGARRATPPDALNNWHVSFGVVILAVMLARLVWRFAAGAPEPERGLPAWQEAASAAVHWLIYVLVFAVVFSGWASAATHRWPITLFWLVSLPGLFPPAAVWAHDFGELHAALMWVLLAAIGLHAAAALAHHFILRDGVLLRMLPLSARGRALARRERSWSKRPPAR